MKEEKLIQYLFSSKKKRKSIIETLDDKQKYDTRLLAFLSSDKVDAALYRRILLQIPTKIIPRMANPLLLADFLTSSYETQSNASKILALHGLYVLLTQYNLEYPFFFGKLYSLLTIDLFNAKYKARFFYLLDIFLQSSHLPVNLVASFARRLARLALLIPQYDQCLIITFIYNLCIRHPQIRIMIDRQPSQSTDPIKDNYLSEEIDPNKTNAIDSSLWEIETLTHHHHPDVATCALAFTSLRKINSERDIHDLLEIDYDEMFEHDINRRIRSRKTKDKTKTTTECPINYNVTVNLFD
ncbi:unnamed protein product [Adineta steineri]|uniref:CCAAT-binding factor domain-containing protein n=1 Tax=Adineta steineri TaxID=433720 RepID=A0A818VP79_9BILA|nr:unnamed protein product [Adineta steineri]